MLKCSKCKSKKKETEFAKDSTRSRGYAYVCKACRKPIAQNHYEKNKEQYTDWRKARAAENDAIVKAAKDVPCTDCGEQFPFYAMQFDHLPQYKKSFTISNNRLVSPDALRAEIDKCEVVCANCHAGRTWHRRYGSGVRS